MVAAATRIAARQAPLAGEARDRGIGLGGRCRPGQRHRTVGERQHRPGESRREDRPCYDVQGGRGGGSPAMVQCRASSCERQGASAVHGIALPARDHRPHAPAEAGHGAPDGRKGENGRHGTGGAAADCRGSLEPARADTRTRRSGLDSGSPAPPTVPGRRRPCCGPADRAAAPPTVPRPRRPYRGAAAPRPAAPR
jgi:hypothetical protein